MSDHQYNWLHVFQAHVNIFQFPVNLGVPMLFDLAKCISVEVTCHFWEAVLRVGVQSAHPLFFPLPLYPGKL